MSDIERISTASWRNVPRLETRSFRNNRRTIGGYGAVFGVPSDPRLGFREIVERSCFNKSAGDGWPGVIALFEHQPGIVLGAVHSGTMRLKQDSYGLDYEVDLPRPVLPNMSPSSAVMFTVQVLDSRCTKTNGVRATVAYPPGI